MSSEVNGEDEQGFVSFHYIFRRLDKFVLFAVTC